MHYFDSLDLFSVFHSEGAVGAQEQWASMAIIIEVYMSMAIITVEILSNMETTCFGTPPRS